MMILNRILILCFIVLLPIINIECQKLVPYPVEDESRSKSLNELFHYEVVRLALESLDAILDMSNVSSKLSSYQHHLEKEKLTYESLVDSAEGVHNEILECKVKVDAALTDCSDCLLETCGELGKSCGSESVFSAFDDSIPLMKHLSKAKFKTLSFNINHDELLHGKQLVDSIQMELKKVFAFFIRLLSLFTDNIESKEQMQVYLSQRLDVSSSELLTLFRSIKIFSLVRSGEIEQSSHQTVEGVIEGVAKLMNTVGGVNTSVVTAEDVQEMMDFPVPKKEAKLWDEILGSLENLWGSVQGGASKVWDTTKDVSKTAFCSVKSVFFDSKCDDSKRRRRSVELLGKPYCDKKSVFNLVAECETNYLEKCPACSKMLDSDICGSDFGEKLTSFNNLAFDIMKQGLRLKNSIAQVDANRLVLINQTKQNLEDNLWFISMNKLLQGKKNPFDIKNVYYDPGSFTLEKQRVKYNGVQIYMVVDGSRDASRMIFSVPPLDVHNITEIAQHGAEIFVNAYKQWPSVQATVALLLGNVEELIF